MAGLSKHNISNLVLLLQQKGRYSTFIETGTYLGETARWASSHFQQVVTIELSEELYGQAKALLEGSGNIQAVQGDSGKLLGEVLNACPRPVIFWLDGHHSFGNTAGAHQECPLIQELYRIKESGRSDHVVLIDDAHMFLSPPPDPHKTDHWPLFGDVLDRLRDINSSYYIVVWENVIIAVPENLRTCVRDHLTSHRSYESLSKTNPPHENLLLEKGLWQPSKELKLHLGCGEKHLEGYVNIDYPRDHHNVLHPQSDLEMDITELRFSESVVGELRLHHVFEHFDRVTALALLIRWHSWLKIGGTLQIETPDVIGSAKMLLSDHSYRTKVGIVRHLVGDQSAEWGYHVEQWFPERFVHTLKALGFAEVTTRSWNWEEEPYLSNVEVVAIKSENRPIDEQLSIADKLLWESTVSDSEIETHEAWRKKLRALLGRPCESRFVFEPRTETRIACEPTSVAAKSSSAVRGFWDKLWPPRQSSATTLHALEELASQLPLEVIQNFNQQNRDHWVASKAQTVPADAIVLDVGAGTCRYRKEFSHCNYETHDFKRYEGYRNNKEGRYGEIDYISDITAIPVPENSYDAVLCTEVLEHVTEPIAALQEIARILKPGGRLFITAPLGSGLHQTPYHFYGGFTPYWYRHFCPKSGLSVMEITPNGGFFKLLAQECARVAWTMPEHEHVHGRNKEIIGTVFGEMLPRFLFALEDRCMIDQFTVGYHVEAKKIN